MRHSRLAHVIGSSFLLACASASPAEPEPEPPADVCAGANGLVLKAPASAEVIWDGASKVGPRVAVTVLWCGKGVLRLAHMDVRDGGDDPSVSYDFGLEALYPHEQLGRVVGLPAQPGDYRISALGFRDKDRRLIATRSIAVVAPRAGEQGVVDTRCVD